VSHQCSYCLAHTTSSNSNMVCEKQHTVCYALHDGLQQLMSEMLHNLISCL